VTINTRQTPGQLGRVKAELKKVYGQTPTASGGTTFAAPTGAVKALFQAGASESADLIQCKNSGAATVFRVNPNGYASASGGLAASGMSCNGNFNCTSNGSFGGSLTLGYGITQTHTSAVSKFLGSVDFNYAASFGAYNGYNFMSVNCITGKIGFNSFMDGTAAGEIDLSNSGTNAPTIAGAWTFDNSGDFPSSSLTINVPTYMHSMPVGDPHVNGQLYLSDNGASGQVYVCVSSG
jgi:hypothetical protein